MIELGLGALLVGLVIKEMIDNSGRRHIHDRINNLNGKYVQRDHCHGAISSIHRRINDMEKHLNTRFDDLKEAVKSNGKAK